MFEAAHERRAVIDNEREMKLMQRKLKDVDVAMRDMKKKHDDQLYEMKEKNRSLAAEYDKQKSEAEMHFLNLMARMNTCKMIDHEVLNEFRRLCENFEHASKVRNRVAKREPSSSSARPKRLSRSRSSSCISPVVITTEEERRTRSNRARIHRFGDVKNPIDVIETDSEEEESVVDTSYHPTHENHPHYAEKRRTRLAVVTDLSPIPDLTHIHHDSTGEGPMSPRSRRQSKLLSHPPAPIFAEEGKENICNETFLVDSGTSSCADRPDAGDCAPDDPNPLRNATLVSGLVPDLDPALGPL